MGAGRRARIGIRIGCPQSSGGLAFQNTGIPLIIAPADGK